MKIKHSISILFMILLLASCKDGLTIFDQIDQETKLEDAVITGSVHSIVKSGNTLYASDANIYAKSVNGIKMDGVTNMNVTEMIKQNYVINIKKILFLLLKNQI